MTTTLPVSAVCDQLLAAGLGAYVRSCRVDDKGLRGRMDLSVLPTLRADARFVEGPFWGLHRDVGSDPTDFRAHGGSFGKGSLQIVIDQATGEYWADVDRFCPYSDAVGFLGHAFGEVIPGWFRKVFRRKGGAA